jgi:hypothetical protein
MLVCMGGITACAIVSEAIAETPISQGATIQDKVQLAETFITAERLSWLAARAHARFPQVPPEQLNTIYVQYTVFNSWVDSRKDRVVLQVKLREGPIPAQPIVDYCRDLLAAELQQNAMAPGAPHP